MGKDSFILHENSNCGRFLEIFSWYRWKREWGNSQGYKNVFNWRNMKREIDLGRIASIDTLLLRTFNGHIVSYPNVQEGLESRLAGECGPKVIRKDLVYLAEAIYQLAEGTLRRRRQNYANKLGRLTEKMKNTVDNAKGPELKKRYEGLHFNVIGYLHAEARIALADFFLLQNQDSYKKCLVRYHLLKDFSKKNIFSEQLIAREARSANRILSVIKHQCEDVREVPITEIKQEAEDFSEMLLKK